MSGDPDQEYFAEGISEDLITELARIRWLFVIARNSSFVYKNRSFDVKEVSRALGVRYVLEGSVRRAGKRVRITAQLVDATTGGHHWAEQYDRKVGDIFAVQDEITRSVAAAIEPHLLAAEGLRAMSRSPAIWAHGRLVARAQTHVSRMSKADYCSQSHPRRGRSTPIQTTRRHEACSDFASCSPRTMDGSIAQPSADGPRAGQPAVALDDRDPWGHFALGYSAMMEQRTEESLAAFRLALNLNPNSAAAHCPPVARPDVRRVMSVRRSSMAKRRSAKPARSDDGDVVSEALPSLITSPAATGGDCNTTSKPLRLRPGFQGAHRMRCAALLRLGASTKRGRRWRGCGASNPQLSIAWIRANVPYQTPELMERFLDGMRKAGLD